jgi:hypothetical protein
MKKGRPRHPFHHFPNTHATVPPGVTRQATLSPSVEAKNIACDTAERTCSSV